ncbi:MAG: serine hydrolase [Chitinophagaceae bacterium]|nr:serine hydrolase [Chitinophagaceae bacterium]
MRILFTILAAFLLTNAIHAQKARQTPADKRLIGLDTALSKLLKDWHAAGFAVAVVEKDKIVYSKGFGYRDYEKKLPVTANTLFAIGSCTKAFTASLLGILEKQERLKLDDKVTDVLPGFHFFNKEMDNTLTLRDLMTHRTGMPRHDLSWYLFNTSSRDSLMKRIRYQEPSAGIREKWQYNNFMFLLQGVVSEKLWGRTWEENIRTQLLDPLGMQRSNTDIHLMDKDSDAAKGYVVKKDSLISHVDYYNINGMGPAGSINSSVDEMAKWLMLWIQGGKFGGKEILPPGYVNQAMGSQMVIGTGVPGRENPDVHLSNYGLGWFISSYRGHYRVEHGGNIDGFTASTCFFPSDSIGIVVLSNQNASNIPALARNIIADRMLRLSYINWNGIRKKASEEAAAQEKKSNPQPANHPGTRPSHAASAYAGSYTNAGYGTIHVINRGDSLFTYFANDSAWLKHYHYDVFSLVGYDKETHQIDTTDDASLRFTFQFGENGEMQSFFAPVEGSLKPIEFTYKPAARKVTADELAKYVGEYELGNMTVQVTVLNSVLHVFVPGQKNYPTEAIGDHRFALKDLEGFSVVFKLNEKGEPVSVDFVQPNGIFTATKKKK